MGGGLYCDVRKEVGSGREGLNKEGKNWEKVRSRC